MAVSAPWPPQLDDVKAELKIDRSDTRDDANLQVTLDIATDYVAEHRAGDFNFSGSDVDADGVALPAVPYRVFQGTVRLAVRWHTLRRSPDGLVDSGEFGTVRVPNVPADIERMLGLGNFRRPLVG